MRRTDRSWGFSLLEILTLVLIVGVIALVVIPQFGSQDEPSTSTPVSVELPPGWAMVQVVAYTGVGVWVEVVSDDDPAVHAIVRFNGTTNEWSEMWSVRDTPPASLP